MLSKHVQHKQVVAIDVVPEMLTHAMANNADDTTIEYALQDMTVSWLELSPRIRQLESKVDLLFTSFMLHFIPDKCQVMDILSKLLTSGGLFYANIVITADLNRKLVDNNNSRVDKQLQQQLWYPSIDKQMNNWKQSLIVNGFVIKQFNLFAKNYLMTRKQIIDFMPVIVGDFSINFKDRKQFDEEKAEHLWDTVFDAHFSPPSDSTGTASVANPNAWKKFLADNTITELRYYYHTLRVIAYNNKH
ncbi:uncharacterized protein LOC128957437 [Oppia nitens]|uniref:uncharacterized protein LOC128957437 n=1 Tax=Oppia nitens TaxID=1686743 RepID=UPI0023D99CA2|nr:uncharacterized protein LOC128957437 [Oppia nitens]